MHEDENSDLITPRFCLVLNFAWGVIILS